MARRLEITLSDETWERLERARVHEPRASFVKRALESATEVGSGEDARVSPAGLAASSRQAFKCPDPKCGFRAFSAKAVCGNHGKRVVPA